MQQLVQVLRRKENKPKIQIMEITGIMRLQSTLKEYNLIQTVTILNFTIIKYTITQVTVFTQVVIMI